MAGPSQRREGASEWSIKGWRDQAGDEQERRSRAVSDDRPLDQAGDEGERRSGAARDGGRPRD
ncbi:hypothetical protein COCNU_04G008430 [Cocos nucifera]|uniref:Uncharacterized protein n=1 Tax=Cocos nucifera TaxID=13894 RepID=A0A8K0I6S6_COCNU|nr:hypothetical protein COCNU_04G008430 [Cocos nucifera]